MKLSSLTSLLTILLTIYRDIFLLYIITSRSYEIRRLAALLLLKVEQVVIISLVSNYVENVIIVIIVIDCLFLLSSESRRLLFLGHSIHYHYNLADLLGMTTMVMMAMRSSSSEKLNSFSDVC
jgi:hypothetical protein